MISSKLVTFFASAAVFGFGLIVAGLSLDVFALSAFAATVVALLLLAITRDYAPQSRRFEPQIRRASRRVSERFASHRSRYPLAA